MEWGIKKIDGRIVIMNWNIQISDFRKEDKLYEIERFKYV